jgi:photosystem II stability/assembly factor-like uncharacterized protein
MEPAGEPAAELEPAAARVTPRVRRALGLIALSVMVLVVAGIVYVRPHVTAFSTTSPSIVGPMLTRSGDLLSYDFVTATTGWAVDNTRAGQLWVFRTDDGAKHWKRQMTALGPVPGYAAVSMRFPDKTHAFIIIGSPIEVFRTTSGGNEWNPVPLPPPQIDAVDFSDSQNGWAVGTEHAAVPRSLLFTTRNGGDTWTQLADPPAGSDVFNLSFRGRFEGWVGASGPGGPRVYTSADGGASWQSHNLPTPPAATAYVPDFFNTLVTLMPGAGAVAWVVSGCAALAKGGVPCPAVPAAEFTSFDGGSTWRYVSPPPAGIDYRQVSYQDAFNWWVVNAGTLYRSLDAGQTWTTVTNQLGEYQYVAHFLDSQHGWAQVWPPQGNGVPPARDAASGLAFSNDGGRHWTRATVPQRD